MTRETYPDHTEAGALVTRLILATFRTNGRLLRTGDQMVRDFGLTSGRWQVIAAIEDQPRSVAQIAREYELSRQGVLWVVRTMIKDGMVILVDNPEHRRAKLVKLTEKGREAGNAVSELQVKWANAMGEAFTLRELKATIECLERLGVVAVA